MSTSLLTAKEVGDLLSVPATWVLEQARRGRIPHVRLGRYVRFRRDSIEGWCPRWKPGGGPRNVA